MTKVFFRLALLTAALGAFTACREEDKLPAPDVTSVPLFFPIVDRTVTEFDTVLRVPTLVTTRSIASDADLPNTPAADDLENPDLPNRGKRPVLQFSINITDQRDVRLKAVEVYASLRRGTGGLIGPRVLKQTITSFPATVTLTGRELIAGLQYFQPRGNTREVITVDDPAFSRPRVFKGDYAIITFEYVLEDDSRVILTPLVDYAVTSTLDVKVPSGTLLNQPYALPVLFN